MQENRQDSFYSSYKQTEALEEISNLHDNKTIKSELQCRSNAKIHFPSIEISYLVLWEPHRIPPPSFLAPDEKNKQNIFSQNFETSWFSGKFLKIILQL